MASGMFARDLSDVWKDIQQNLDEIGSALEEHIQKGSKWLLGDEKEMTPKLLERVYDQETDGEVHIHLDLADDVAFDVKKDISAEVEDNTLMITISHKRHMAQQEQGDAEKDAAGQKADEKEQASKEHARTVVEIGETHYAVSHKGVVEGNDSQENQRYAYTTWSMQRTIPRIKPMSIMKDDNTMRIQYDAAENRITLPFDKKKRTRVINVETDETAAGQKEQSQNSMGQQQ